MFPKQDKKICSTYDKQYTHQEVINFFKKIIFHFSDSSYKAMIISLLLLITWGWLADLAGRSFCNIRIMINATSKTIFVIEETIILNIKSTIKMRPTFKQILIPSGR